MFKKFFHNLKFIWSYSKQDKKYLFFIVILNIILVSLYIISPILSAKVIINITNNLVAQLILVAIMIMVINTLINIFNYLCSICGNKIRRNSLKNIKIDIGKDILKIENNCLDKNTSGTFIQRINNDTNNLSGVFDSLLGNVFTVIKNIGVFVAIFLVSKVVCLYLIISLIIIFIIQKKCTDKEMKEEKINRKYNDNVTGFIGEMVRGTRDIKMLNCEDDFISKLDNKIGESNDYFFKTKTHALNHTLMINIIKNSIDLLLLLLLGFLMLNNYFIPTMAVILYNYSTVVKRSIFTLDSLFNMIKEVNLSCERLKEVIDDDKFAKENFGNIHLKTFNGNFEFRNVSFAYQDKKVLNNINFKINSNEMVAIVGKSGAGKTTIFNLICKMYNVDNGSILLDGLNINELDKDSIRGNITIISQNPYIFNASIEDNLKMVKKDLTEKEMIEACQMAVLDDYINTLPDKYQTIIGENGLNLSGGQRQRLAIARAFIQKTKIILFDEATSALDNETQYKIQESIEKMNGKYTIIIIAHRLSTIKNADRILVLDKGKIIAEGKHHELLNNCLDYKKLYETEIEKEI